MHKKHTQMEYIHLFTPLGCALRHLACAGECRNMTSFYIWTCGMVKDFARENVTPFYSIGMSEVDMVEMLLFVTGNCSFQSS